MEHERESLIDEFFVCNYWGWLCVQVQLLRSWRSSTFVNECWNNVQCLIKVSILLRSCTDWISIKSFNELMWATSRWEFPLNLRLIVHNNCLLRIYMACFDISISLAETLSSQKIENLMQNIWKFLKMQYIIRVQHRSWSCDSDQS